MAFTLKSVPLVYRSTPPFPFWSCGCPWGNIHIQSDMLDLVQLFRRGGNRCLVVEKYFGKAVFDEWEQLGYILVKALPQSTGRWHLLYTHWAPEPVIMLVIVNGIEVARPLDQQTGRFWVSQKALKRWKSGPGDLTWKALVWAFHVDFLALNLRIQALDSGWFSASW